MSKANFTSQAGQKEASRTPAVPSISEKLVSWVQKASRKKGYEKDDYDDDDNDDDDKNDDFDNDDGDCNVSSHPYGPLTWLAPGDKKNYDDDDDNDD